MKTKYLVKTVKKCFFEKVEYLVRIYKSGDLSCKLPKCTKYIYIYIYIYVYDMGSSYTFFKPLDLSRSNGQKKTIINANILIDFIYYPLFNTFHTCF